MRSLKQQIIIQAPLNECIKRWTAADYYPHPGFKEGMAIPEIWSSEDAWGEHWVGGSRQLEWSLTSYRGASIKQINWRVQSYFNKQLIQWSGVVQFEPQRDGKESKILMQLNWDESNEAAMCLVSESVLNQCLETFKNTMSMTPVFLPLLKVAV